MKKEYLVSLDELLRNNTTQKGDCLFFVGKKDRNGYGRFQHKRKHYMVHRLAFALANNILFTDLSSDICILHSCDNPSCCNPNHLRSGTPKDNANDAVSRNRNTKPKGELHPHHKFTNSQIEEIRKQYKPGVFGYRKLANLYNVHPATIGKIIHRERWQHI